jgi:hypothetical protein
VGRQQTRSFLFYFTNDEQMFEFVENAKTSRARNLLICMKSSEKKIIKEKLFRHISPEKPLKCNERKTLPTIAWTTRGKM